MTLPAAQGNKNPGALVIPLPASSPPPAVPLVPLPWLPAAGRCSCPALPHPRLSFGPVSGPQASTLVLSARPSGFSSEQPEQHPSGAPSDRGSRCPVARRRRCPRWLRHILLFMSRERAQRRPGLGSHAQGTPAPGDFPWARRLPGAGSHLREASLRPAHGRCSRLPLRVPVARRS